MYASKSKKDREEDFKSKILEKYVRHFFYTGIKNLYFHSHHFSEENKKERS